MERTFSKEANGGEHNNLLLNARADTLTYRSRHPAWFRRNPNDSRTFYLEAVNDRSSKGLTIFGISVHRLDYILRYSGRRSRAHTWSSAALTLKLIRLMNVGFRRVVERHTISPLIR